MVHIGAWGYIFRHRYYIFFGCVSIGSVVKPMHPLVQLILVLHPILSWVTMAVVPEEVEKAMNLCYPLTTCCVYSLVQKTWQAFSRKNAEGDLQKELLLEVVSSFFLANETCIPEIRNSED